MPVDADILAILACPSADHAPLREQTRDGQDILVCSYCATEYPIRDGIPVLLVDDAVPGPNGIGQSAPPTDTDTDPADGAPVPA